LATENKYRYSKAYYKILNLILSNPDENVFVIRGGQGAGKTISILELVIQSLLKSEKEATVLSSELSKMKRTVVRDYKKICRDWGVIRNETDFNKSESKHEYPNDSYIDFIGADVSDVGKGFRRDILYINEADKISIDSAVQFISRAKLTIIDYNPDSLFWGDDFITDNNFLTLTFEDNEFLSESEVLSILDYKERGFHDTTLEGTKLFDEPNIKNKYWANKWKVYGLGLVGSLDGVVFPEWSIIDSVPPDAKRVGYGVDFGYTNDPTTTVIGYEYNGQRIYDEVIYQTGLSNGDHASLIKSNGISKRDIGYADSADPKSIDELCKSGLTVKPVTKGADSIMYGIGLMQEKPFLITKRSTNLKKELENYTWAKDKDGNEMNKPIDAWNHLCDAARYLEMMLKIDKPKKIRSRTFG
jgi:phage terminase large subunit